MSQINLGVLYLLGLVAAALARIPPASHSASASTTPRRPLRILALRLPVTQIRLDLLFAGKVPLQLCKTLLGKARISTSISA
jgi:hypothetical protein